MLPYTHTATPNPRLEPVASSLRMGGIRVEPPAMIKAGRLCCWKAPGSSFAQTYLEDAYGMRHGRMMPLDARVRGASRSPKTQIVQEATQFDLATAVYA
jgi:hypothetical protein